MSSYPRIEDYGLIGDCRSAALVSRHGSIDWCCLPRFDSPSLFSRLLDKDRGGTFSISPKDEYSSTISYRKDTNLLETHFLTRSGRARLTDCFSATSEDRKEARLWPDHEILRKFECLAGTFRIALKMAPRLEFGKTALTLHNRGKWGVECNTGDRILLFQSSLPMSHMRITPFLDGDALTAEFTLNTGDTAYFSLTYSDEAPATFPAIASAPERMNETERYWKQWISTSREIAGEYQDHFRRSLLALKLLTFAPSGAVIAAPTTSLPEVMGGSRNWDYRYCWLRDASLTIRALSTAGYLKEAEAYLSWMIHSTRLTHPELQVMYSLYGHTKLPVRNLSWLDGFKGSKPVRTGNEAATQFQLDLYGEVLNGVYQLIPYLQSIDRATERFLIDLSKAVCRLWKQPDQGIWEMPGAPAHYTQSKAMAWVALDRVIRISERTGCRIPDEIHETAAEIRRCVEEHGYNKRISSYTQTLDGQDLDASLLVLPLVEYCSASNPRLLNTIHAIQRHLSKNGLIYRYRPESDGLPGREGAFGICSFWMAEALARSGQYEAGKSWFDELLKRQNSVGLWPEEIDPDTGEFLGNYPQAFTHVGLINAAVELEQAKARSEGRAQSA